MTAAAARVVPTVVVVATLALAAAPVRLEGRAQGARDRYEAALVLDRAARAAVELRESDDRIVRAAARALAAYESVVRRFPTSGYCDNALMRGGDLAVWLFGRTGREADRAAAARYYAWLLREYPGSGLRAQAQSAVRAIDRPEARLAARRPAAAASVAGPGRVASDTAVPTTVTTVPARAVTRPTAPVPPIGADGAWAGRALGRSTLRGIDQSLVGSGVRVTLSLDRESAFAYEVIDGPRRAFVDLFDAVPAADLQHIAQRDTVHIVRHVRVGTRPNATRVVLDLDAGASVSVFTLYSPFRVVIDAERPVAPGTGAVPMVAALGSRFSPAEPVAPLVLRDDAPLAPRDENEVVPPGSLPVVQAGAAEGSPNLDAPEATADEVAAVVPAAPAINGDGSFSLARQLGLGISRIVIDPGHGGHDPGTLTNGTTEARLVLDVALRLEKLLKKEPGLEVVLTRRTDVFIPLEQRPAIANRVGADVFLSIHANASRDKTARGVETYFLSFASNPEAESVAARENATSASDMHTLPSIVRAITLNNKLDESRDLASLVQQTLTARLSKTNVGLRSRGVKKAPFVVLIGAGMPSVLAEVGFLTNRQESALVKTPAYRQKIAESLHAAVMQYRRALKRQTAVAAR